MFDPQFYDPAQAAVVDQAGGFIVSGNRYNGVVLPGDQPTDAALSHFPFLRDFTQLYHGLPAGFAPTHKRDFQPRVGLAYSIDQKTMVRVGVGKFFNRTGINRDLAQGGQAPFMEQVTVINGSVDAPRPFRGLGIIGLAENTGRTEYDAVQISANRRLSAGLQFGLGYTFSRNLDNGSGEIELLPNAYDDSTYWGRSDLDRPHVLVANAIYELPSPPGPRLIKVVLGGWSAAGIFQAQSGGPFSVRQSVDYAGIGPGSGDQFWNQIGDPNQVTRTEFTDSAVWFNRDAFAQPAPGTFGVQRRNSLRQPGFGYGNRVRYSSNGPSAATGVNENACFANSTSSREQRPVSISAYPICMRSTNAGADASAASFMPSSSGRSSLRRSRTRSTRFPR
jgi:hypothetical protein